MIYYTESNGDNLKIELKQDSTGRTVVQLPDGSQRVADFVPILGSDFYSLLLDNHSYEVYLEPAEGGYNITLHGSTYFVRVESERAHRFAALTPHSNANSGEVTVKAPMPGLVSIVAVEVGQAIEQGQRLLILEAMKMENEIRAPRAGTVKTVHIQSGQTVEQNRPLVVIE